MFRTWQQVIGVLMFVLVLTSILHYSWAADWLPPHNGPVTQVQFRTSVDALEQKFDQKIAPLEVEARTSLNILLGQQIHQLQNDLCEEKDPGIANDLKAQLENRQRYYHDRTGSDYVLVGCGP